MSRVIHLVLVIAVVSLAGCTTEYGTGGNTEPLDPNVEYFEIDESKLQREEGVVTDRQ